MTIWAAELIIALLTLDASLPRAPGVTLETNSALFDVARGSIVALLGSNGAGKTTVARILATRLRADAGTAGVDVESHAARVRESTSLPGAVHRRRRGPHRAGEPGARGPSLR